MARVVGCPWLGAFFRLANQVVCTTDRVVSIYGEWLNDRVRDLIDVEGDSFNSFSIIWHEQGVNEVMVPFSSGWADQVLHSSIWWEILVLREDFSVSWVRKPTVSLDAGLGTITNPP